MVDGRPHLAILSVENCVHQGNTQYVADELFDAAVEQALVQGNKLIVQLLQNESGLPGE